MKGILNPWLANRVPASIVPNRTRIPIIFHPEQKTVISLHRCGKRCPRIYKPTVPRIKQPFAVLLATVALSTSVATAMASKAVTPASERHQRALPAAGADGSGLLFPRVDYQAKVSDEEARVVAEITVDSPSQAEGTLFEGELALVPPKLPSALRIERSG